ncbi:MAG: hypothetical protein H7039_15795 [Bryobacteraceae bacterium]|nr:hypothetical protein [Bryobacteraceae bacterium]
MLLSLQEIPLITNIQKSAVIPAAQATSAAAKPSTATASTFDQQLSQALSESLQRLGVRPGEINISIKTGAGSLSSRQIVITYNGADTPSTSTTASPTATTPGSLTDAITTVLPAAPAEPRLNPFNMLATPGKSWAETHPNEVTETAWCPTDGPRDSRDSIPTGGGKVTATGSPDIQINAAAARNQYNYTGAAAYNPYFTNPGNPLRDGYVLGFGNWFEDAQIMGSKNGPTAANKILYASEEGGKEALRLVQQQIPGAELVQQTWGGGPFMANKPMYLVKLPDGGLMNAGGILSTYYTGGMGVMTSADADLAKMIGSNVSAS